MQIDAPFSVSVVENTESQTRELHLSFTQSFQNAPLESRYSQPTLKTWALMQVARQISKHYRA